MRKSFLRKAVIACLTVILACGLFAACNKVSGKFAQFRVECQSTDAVYGDTVTFTTDLKLTDIAKGAIGCSLGSEITVTGKNTFTVTVKREGLLSITFSYNNLTSNVVKLNVKRKTQNISTAAELAAASDESVRYILQNDIDMTGTTHTPAAFSGALDGAGHSIKNFTYLPTELGKGKNMAFWSENNGTIENVTFIDADVGVYSEAASAAIVAGVNNGTIENVTVSGKLEAEQTSCVGGVAGANKGTIVSCTSTATVTGKDCTGGIVGDSTSAVSDSVNKGAVSGGSKVGGVVGSITENATVYGSKNEGAVTAGAIDAYVGGIVGFAADDKSVNVNSSRNSGDVTAALGSYAGGIIGKGGNTMLFDCHNEGLVRAESRHVGGIGARVYSARRCTNMGMVTAAGKDVQPDKNGFKSMFVGGIAGYLKRVEECVNEQRIELTADGSCIGGIVGYLDGEGTESVMNNNVNRGNVTATNSSSYIGGIAGFWKNAAMRGASNAGNITGGSNTGGIFGYGESGGLYFSSNTGTVSGSPIGKTADKGFTVFACESGEED